MSRNPCMPEETSCRLLVVALNDFIELLGGKWRFPIIFSLYFSPLRFNELKSLLDPITARALTQNLNDLEMNHLIEKDPETKQFRLSNHSAGLETVVNVVCEYHEMSCIHGENDTGLVKASLNEAMKAVFRDLAGKWRMVIMGTLFYGDVSRFSELQALIPGISAKELSRNLKSLTESGIVEQSMSDLDPRGTYRLTEKGKRFEIIMQEMVKWAMSHREFLKDL